MNEYQKQKKMTRLLCKWNRKEISGDDLGSKLWDLYEKECLETWNDPLEVLLV